jgi:hypothetical protein
MFKNVSALNTRLIRRKNSGTADLKEQTKY